MPREGYDLFPGQAIPQPTNPEAIGRFADEYLSAVLGRGYRKNRPLSSGDWLGPEEKPETISEAQRLANWILGRENPPRGQSIGIMPALPTVNMAPNSTEMRTLKNPILEQLRGPRLDAITNAQLVDPTTWYKALGTAIINNRLGNRRNFREPQHEAGP